jgi:hypothetical protein
MSAIPICDLNLLVMNFKKKNSEYWIWWLHFFPLQMMIDYELIGLSKLFYYINFEELSAMKQKYSGCCRQHKTKWERYSEHSIGNNVTHRP